MNGGLIDNVGAIVLCGGKSRRMGRPKAWLPFGTDEVLLQRLVRLVGAVASSIVVVAAPKQMLPPLDGSVRIVRDSISDRGPLQGIADGLSEMPEGIDLVYATATDVPFLVPDWIRLLRERIRDADIAIPFVGGFFQPMAALYRREGVQRSIADLLAADRLRLVDLLEEARAIIVNEDDLRSVDPSLGTLRNLNTPEDYEAALRDLHC